MSESPALHDRFELSERVGSGAFGEVWRAFERGTGRRVAIKRMHEHLTDPALSSRFRREAAMLGRVRSPHVVRYLDEGLDERGAPWIATEWLEGQDLAHFRLLPACTLRAALWALRDAARGTAALHATGVVHRDLKPANVFVTELGPGEVLGRLVDLGIAHAVDATALTQTGSILGSPSYMAPEQVRGERVDAAADAWALGVMLFELCTGDPPFGAGNAIVVLGKVLLEPVPRLRSLSPAAPAALDALVSRLLDKDAVTRLRDAEAVAHALTVVLDDPETQRWLDGPVPHTGTSSFDADETQQLGRGERRLVSLVLLRHDAGPAHALSTLLERHGGRAEWLRGAWLGAFGLTRSRGDELLSAGRSALEAQGARGALVSGWVEVRGGVPVPGPLIECAAELLEGAGPGQVRVAPQTAAALEQSFTLLRDPSGALCLGPEHARNPASPNSAPPLLLGRTVPLLGREKELRLLEGVVRAAVDEGAVQVALVVGEPGLGKSRILYELLERLRASEQGISLLTLRGEPMLADAAHGVLIQGLRAALGIDEGEGNAEAWRVLTDYAAPRLDGDLLAIDYLGQLLRLPERTEASDTVRAARQDPSLLRQRMREVLARLVRAETRRAPMLLAVEDLHWVDRPTVETLGWLLEELGELPLVVLCFARPEVHARHPQLWAGVACTELKLAPLSTRASEQLVSAVLELTEAERRAIVQRAAGNPLFLGELVRARAEGVQELPAAVHATLQARLDTLSADARRVAQAASVLGQVFWSEAVEAMNVVPATAPALGELVRSEVLLARPGSRYTGTTEYAFHHAIVRDAAYAMLLHDERAELHARAALWLERAGETDGAVLGQHFEAGGRGSEAAMLFTRVAERALAESAFEEAERYATRAITSEGRGHVAAVAFLLRAEARRALGRSREILEDARAAMALTQEDPALHIRAMSHVATGQRVMGDLDGADRTLRQVLEESHATLLASRVQALLELSLVDLAKGRGAEAGTLVDEALSWLESAPAEFQYQRLLALRARVETLTAIGDLGAALRAAHEALSQALAVGHRARAAEARLALARALNLVGRPAEAREQVGMAMGEGAALRAPQINAQGHQQLGHARLLEGELAVALLEFDEAARLADVIGSTRVRLFSRAYGVLCRLELGEDPDAVLTLALAVQTEAKAYAPMRCAAAALVARAMLRAARPREAMEQAVDSMAGLRAMGALDEWEEGVRLAYAEVLAAAGRREEAETVVHQAVERVQRKAGKLNDPAVRKSYLQGVLWNRRLLNWGKR